MYRRKEGGHCDIKKMRIRDTLRLSRIVLERLSIKLVYITQYSLWLQINPSRTEDKLAIHIIRERDTSEPKCSQ